MLYPLPHLKKTRIYINYREHLSLKQSQKGLLKKHKEETYPHGDLTEIMFKMVNCFKKAMATPLDAGHKLYAHKTFKRCRLFNVLSTSNLLPVSRGICF